ncbi:ESX secretion-associated protein EspG [Gordonia araii]|uniref:ESX secretion-associated protein EspG n=1 Tax=Gordonia araii TaxID=263909 RepID=UPI00111037BD|nr:ESX secretion-associated protein EspG [Gordonia araii]NNG97973.1 hypothetical protein [Gordonia araii NBRC 100433]
MAEQKIKLRPLGRVRSLAVDMFCEGIGRDRMPFPFMATSRFDDIDEDERDRREIDHMLEHDPPEEFIPWMRLIGFPDLTMHLYGVYPQDEGPMDRTIRISGVRMGDLAYLATQEPTDELGHSGDIVVYEVPAVDLHTAMVRLTPRCRAGGLGNVRVRLSGTMAVPKRTDLKPEEWERRQRFTSNSSEFSAFFQIVEGPSRDWGLDPKATKVFWEHRSGDGQYLMDRSDGGKLAIPVDSDGLETAVTDAVREVVRRVRSSRDAIALGEL